ncbi:uncharacterized protein L3040_000129 [Drepanopeziza brunnea f. sp. 'multigermtubi']|uniref:non-specific serine/threonine protein kinase n=1 Tax=Marssonina brunnea f. sp. multigermtubi (strain MB_m1) TaxID=1072389 RepID=K1WBB3_MARBU|nr:serine/threonine-protein kinase GIN4 [Drepanopeziza brunnea f. sp. 'multigermtubi' MB_m1]EKD14605.1 serine/threonine-protein kinase GIN4 [Drepanopeziza brunnea f. sp. 'multigermtubi' MB_m1]KAJ5053838.1 hypothetical protein L3040_000129 [Drepanopeziza brunnea f. sp. 'multigermtubi']
MNNYSRPSTRRAPLGEATRRINNSDHSRSQGSPKPSPMPHHESRKPDGLLQKKTHKEDKSSGHTPTRDNPRLSAIKEPNSNRNSAISTTSAESRALKSMIGPWKLGKTLGKGSTARVRLGRHVHTGQEAAIKIMQKSHAQISQAGSLADLEKAEARQSDYDGVKHMPIGIEREVAIMKLVQHPHIMKLYDIWENRTEIYLILELVDKGELFEHIKENVRLSEEEAMLYFRQIISALGYCHSFNICHRDLKPENILLNSQMEIKLADFGMAALHQAPGHKLETSCGSPHYAAPELIMGKAYRGDLVDIWAIGVVLYAMLAGYLPFDNPGSITQLMTQIKSGRYEMPEDISEDAKSLIHRMLQVNPKNRIQMSQIWKHPLLKKYDYLDNFGRTAYLQSPSPNDYAISMGHKDINKELLRNLRSMWHMYTEQQIVDALLSDKPNEQKMFYSLLLKHRQTESENYNPALNYSTSDYHHVKPLALTKAYSTCQFPPQTQNGHVREGSKFTVISNAAETEQSYDPFKASRPQHLTHRNDPAKITIHRAAEEYSWQEEPSVLNRGDSALRPPPRTYASRSSLSSTRSRSSSGQVRAGYKRGVSFNQIHKRVSGARRNSSAPNPPTGLNGRHSNHTEVTDDEGDFLSPVNNTAASTKYIRSRKAESIAAQPLRPAIKPGQASEIFSEDVRQHSSSLAKDCDEAFNWGPSTSGNANKKTKNKHSSLDSRPLPPPPARTTSVKQELLEARKQAELRKQLGCEDSPGYLDRMVNHIDRLIQPLSPNLSTPDRRISSAPSDGRYTSRGLPSIHESHGEDVSPRTARGRALLELQRKVEAREGRIASAPEPWNMKRSHNPDERRAQIVALVKDTIRVVQPSSPLASLSPVRPPAPLTIRKKSSLGVPPLLEAAGSTPGNAGNVPAQASYTHRIDQPSKSDLQHQYKSAARPDNRYELPPISESKNDDDHNDTSTGSIIIKKSSGWFKRNSKTDSEDYRVSIASSNGSRPADNDVSDPYQRPRNPQLQLASPKQPKKKPFNLGRIFKKKLKPDMSISAQEVFDDSASIQDSVMDTRYQNLTGRGNGEDARTRRVAPQQSWLAKLFHVKPASQFLCFSVSQKRARREITALLKDWKRYGIEGLQVDKERNIVFARVSANNFLEMKEVAFACEIMTVIEHGKRNHLSIVRCTQEQGAASTFHTFVETLESVMRVRNLLVADDRKKRMMIKTLNAAT